MKRLTTCISYSLIKNLLKLVEKAALTSVNLDQAHGESASLGLVRNKVRKFLKADRRGVKK